MAGKKTRAAIKHTLVTERKQRGRVDRGAMFPVPPPISDVPVDYAAWLADIKKRIHRERLRVVLSSNAVIVMHPDTGPGDVDHLLPEYEKLLADIAETRSALKAQLLEALTR